LYYLRELRETVVPYTQTGLSNLQKQIGDAAQNTQFQSTPTTASDLGGMRRTALNYKPLMNLFKNTAEESENSAIKMFRGVDDTWQPATFKNLANNTVQRYGPAMAGGTAAAGMGAAYGLGLHSGQNASPSSGVKSALQKLTNLLAIAPEVFTANAASMLPEVQNQLTNAIKACSYTPEQSQKDDQRGAKELNYDQLAQRYLAYGMRYGEQEMYKHLQQFQSEEFTNHVLNLWRDLRLQQARYDERTRQ
jgi:hypothetical protein